MKQTVEQNYSFWIHSVRADAELALDFLGDAVLDENSPASHLDENLANYDKACNYMNQAQLEVEVLEAKYPRLKKIVNKHDLEETKRLLKALLRLRDLETWAGEIS